MTHIKGKNQWEARYCPWYAHNAHSFIGDWSMLG